MEALLRKGAPLQEKNKEFLTPLHVCADKGHCDIMELLLKHGSKVNALDGLGQTGEDEALFFLLYFLLLKHMIPDEELIVGWLMCVIQFYLRYKRNRCEYFKNCLSKA